ncbi:unnamed protein product [Rhizophagus irregularis]|nr:unnamed protein product [Rhizophagus irregularis]CAB5210438.1 unnamed protein product [Rhizophagus irregularis]
MEIQTRTNLVLEDFIDLSQSFDNMETVDLENNDNVDRTTRFHQHRSADFVAVVAVAFVYLIRIEIYFINFSESR